MCLIAPKNYAGSVTIRFPLEFCEEPYHQPSSPCQASGIANPNIQCALGLSLFPLPPLPRSYLTDNLHSTWITMNGLAKSSVHCSCTASDATTA